VPDFDDLAHVGGWAVTRLLYIAPINLGIGILQDVHRSEVRREGQRLQEELDRRALRDELLAALDPKEVFPVGSVLLRGPDDRPDPRPAVCAATEEDLVLLDADVQAAPEVELGRVARADVEAVRLTDDQGTTIAQRTVDERAELDARPDVLYALRLDLRDGGAVTFVFRALSMAVEATRGLERNLATT
jgi:hypothetical protein